MVEQNFQHDIEVLDEPIRRIDVSAQQVTDVYAYQPVANAPEGEPQRREAAGVIVRTGKMNWLGEFTGKPTRYYSPATRVVGMAPEGQVYDKTVRLDTMLAGMRVGLAKKRAAYKVGKALKPYMQQ
jgi:hypothetical protein